ncbi:hypothetical protein Btru_034862 [Bulinus truncatus]|nr:hypothetical protein Btru_034862 [Bulinus truncatus]
MDPEDDPGSVGQGQNLQDLQNYLSTFKKEIEPGDDILSHIDVDAGDVGDLYNSASGNPLQELGEGGVASQFSAGFYSEQGILDTPLSDDPAHQMQSIEAASESDIAAIKQEVRSLDLDAVQAQIASFTDAPLTQGINDMQTTPISGSLIMTSLGESLDPTGGKVIRIVSLDEDGQYLSLGDASQMQILNQDLDMSGDTLTSTNGVLTLQGANATLVSTESRRQTSLLTSSAGSTLVMSGSGDAITTCAGGSSKATLEGGQIVALQNTSDSSQTQILALPQGTTLSAEAMQMSGLLSADGTINSELGFQTITIMPPDLSNGADMNYVLIMAPQDVSKDSAQQLAQILDLKHETQEISEDLVEINGEVKRVLRVVPKKFLAANFGMQLVCDYCDYTSPKRYLLTRHMKSHSDERPHKCKECDRGFKTPASLVNHVNTHTGIRPHKCKHCDAAFTTSGELVRHIRYRHTFEKPHRCPNCDYASVELSKLKRHMRSHTGERPYKCPHCPYASPDTYKLKRHLRIHTGEKPYECDICHTRFTQSNSLKAHKLIHSGNKPVFQCKLCPTTCGRKTDLKIHFNKLHSEGSPLECKKCGHIFSDRYSYKQHVRSHDIDKCFKCDDCDFIANTERSFDAHAAVHSNGKKFECETCHSSFYLKQSLEKHKRICQTGEELDSSSRDKESDDQGADKTPVYKTTVGRPSQQSKMDALLSSESNPASSSACHLASGTPLTSGTLHKNLLQDIKDGKLGDVPQVVIVHPDGSLEEISSKLPPMGDKLNIDDLFSALSSTDQSHELQSNSLEDRSDKDSDDEEEKNIDMDQGSQARADHVRDSVSSRDNDEDIAGESSQCEASTQAELESETDSDSVEDKIGHDSQESKDCQPILGETFDSQADSTLRNEISESITGHKNSSEILQPFIQSIATSSAATSSMTSLLTMASEQPATSNGQQFVVVKGYTCFSGETGQPTLVNVAVDKDSLIKMFASLGGMADGSGVQLLAGDLSSLNLTVDGKTNMISMTPGQLGDFSGIAGMGTVSAEISDLAQTDVVDSSCVGEISLASSLPETSTDNAHMGKQLKFSTLSIDALSMGKSPHNEDSSLPKELLSSSFSSNSKTSPALPSTSFLPQPDMAADQSESQMTAAGSSQMTMPDVEHFSDSMALDVQKFQEVCAAKTDEPVQTSHAEDTVISVIKRKLTPERFTEQGHSSTASSKPDLDNTLIADSVQAEIIADLSEKQRKYSRKRGSSTDPSLVMTGKRVRKALVKVSM